MKHSSILKDLTLAKEAAEADARRLDIAINILKGRPTRRQRHWSAAARKRIADAQRARWARVRAAKAAKAS